MTKRCVLDGRSIRRLSDIYAALAGALGFPDHFGGNLDALYDVLAADVVGPVEIVWRDHRLSQAALGADYDHVLAVLRDAAAGRDDMTLVLD